MRFQYLRLNQLWAVTVLFLLGCGSQKGSSFVDRVGDTNLLSLVTNREQFADKTGAISKNLLAPEIQKSEVIRAHLYFSGVQFVLIESDRSECGVYVTTNLTEFPESGSGIGFTRLKPGFFWFEQEVRDIGLAERLVQKRATNASSGGVTK